MSNYQLLGVDETKPGAPFIRLVNPTEIDKVAKEMARLIKSYYPGWDFANLNLWRKLGLSVESGSGPLHGFLQNYIQLAREKGQSLSAATKDRWIAEMNERFGTRMDDVQDYVRAMLDMISAGTMSKTILKPYDYKPTEVTQDFMKTLFPKLVIATAIVGGVMVLSSSLPLIIASTARARRKYAT